MKIGGMEVGRVLFSSGAFGFFGEGYWWHRLIPGMDAMAGVPVTKTTTLEARAGNASLCDDGVTPSMLQKCVKIRWRNGAVLNAWGLSGPGADVLFQSGRWQARTMPFGISFMSVADSREARLRELRSFIDMLRDYLPGFKTRPFLEINFSCPNAGPVQEAVDLEREIAAALNVAEAADVPVVPNLNALFPVELAARVAKHPACAAVSVANTIKWGTAPSRVEWGRVFGAAVSPLVAMGGGGLSGSPLLPLTLDWVGRAREHGMAKPVIAGGGILSAGDAEKVIRAGADAIKLGTVCILRPWRVRGIAKRAYKIYGG